MNLFSAAITGQQAGSLLSNSSTASLLSLEQFLALHPIEGLYELYDLKVDEIFSFLDFEFLFCHLSSP